MYDHGQEHGIREAAPSFQLRDCDVLGMALA